MIEKLDKPGVRPREDVKEKLQILGDAADTPKKDADKPLGDDVNPRDDNTHQATHQGGLFGNGETEKKTDTPTEAVEVSKKGEEYYKVKAEMDRLVQTERDCNARIRQLENKLTESKLPETEEASVKQELAEYRKKVMEAQNDIRRCQVKLGKLADMPADVVAMENTLNGESVQNWTVNLNHDVCRQSRTPVNGYGWN